MRFYKADLHTHTVLSPCGDLEMSPSQVIRRAKAQGVDILGITDHNTTLQCAVMEKVAKQYGIAVMCGAEVTTKEEVHCLAFFNTSARLNEFGTYVYEHLADFPNNPEKFGYQAGVDENDMILDQPEKLLISATDISIEALSEKVKEMGGIFIPAHIDRLSNGITGQLGFVPPDLNFDALELSRFVTQSTFLEKNPGYKNYPFIQSSDAHYLEDIGAATTLFYLHAPTFDEIHAALKQQGGRKIELSL